MDDVLRQTVVDELERIGISADEWEHDHDEMRRHECDEVPGLTVRPDCMTYDHGMLLIECDVVGGSYYDTARRLFAAAAAFELDEVEDV